jgi:hypothetical protein
MIVKVEESECSGGSGSRAVMAIELHRDSDRALGFTVAQLGAGGKMAGLSGVTVAGAAGPRQSQRGLGAEASTIVVDSLSSPVASDAGAASPATPAAEEGAARLGIDSLAILNPSAVPVPLGDILAVGDLLLSVNGMDLGGKSLSQAISYLRGASDPIRLRVQRSFPASAVMAAKNPMVAANAADAEAAATATSATGAVDAYLQRLERALGPWTRESDPRFVPAPPVTVTAVSMPLLPYFAGGKRRRNRATGGRGDDADADEGGASWSCCSGAAAEDPAERAGPVSTPRGGSGSGGGSSGAPANSKSFYFQIYAGAGCRTLLFDSRTQPENADSSFMLTGGSFGFDDILEEERVRRGAAVWVGTSLHQQSSAVHLQRDKTMAQRRKLAAAAAAGHTAASPASPHAAHPVVFPPGTMTVAGDFRLLVKREGRKKAVAACWLHSAFLPLTENLQGVLANNRALARAAGGNTGTGLHAAPLDSTDAATTAATGAAVQCRLLSGDIPAEFSIAAAVKQASSAEARGGIPSLGAAYTAQWPELVHFPPTPAPAGLMSDNGTIELFKSSLDGVNKDRKHANFPSDFSIIIHYTAHNLPAVVTKALEATS